MRCMHAGLPTLVTASQALVTQARATMAAWASHPGSAAPTPSYRCIARQCSRLLLAWKRRPLHRLHARSHALGAVAAVSTEACHGNINHAGDVQSAVCYELAVSPHVLFPRRLLSRPARRADHPAQMAASSAPATAADGCQRYAPAWQACFAASPSTRHEP